MRKMTVVGLDPLGQRICWHVEPISEDVEGAIRDACQDVTGLQVAGVFEGHLAALDTGTFAEDPR